MAYIGRTNNIEQKFKLNEFTERWVNNVILISLDKSINPLIKNNLKQITSLLINEAKKTFENENNRLKNNNAKINYFANSFDKIQIKEDINEIFEFLKILSIDMFVQKPNAKVVEEGVRVYIDRKGEAEGIFYPETKKILVKKDSCAIKKWYKSANMKKINDILSREEIIEKEGRIYFERDMLFNSPSEAAYLFIGGPNNGWIEWRTRADNKTLKSKYR